MSLEKAIASGEERRRPYRGSRAVDRSCRHGGSCPWCRGNRTVRARRHEAAARADQHELRDGSMPSMPDGAGPQT